MQEFLQTEEGQKALKKAKTDYIQDLIVATTQSYQDAQEHGKTAEKLATHIILTFLINQEEKLKN